MYRSRVPLLRAVHGLDLPVEILDLLGYPLIINV